MTATQFLKHMEYHNSEFKLLEEQKNAYREILDYFNSDVNKGLLLYGDVGTGKTTIFKVWQRILNSTDKRFEIYPERKLARMFLESGYKGLSEIFDNPYTNEYGVISNRPFNICIDDAGIDTNQINFYNNKMNILDEILSDRYDLLMNYGVKTHISTNVVKTILESVSIRTKDRLKEMFVWVNLPGRSFRQ